MSDPSLPTTNPGDALAWKAPAAKKGVFHSWASKNKPEVPAGPKVPRLCGSKPKDPQEVETTDVPAPVSETPNTGLEASAVPAPAAAPAAFSFKFEDPTPVNPSAVSSAPGNPFLLAKSTVDPRCVSKGEEASGEVAVTSGSLGAPTAASAAAPAAFSFKWNGPTTPVNSLHALAKSSALTVDPHRASKGEEARGEVAVSEAPTDVQTSEALETGTAVGAPAPAPAPAAFSFKWNDPTTAHVSERGSLDNPFRSPPPNAATSAAKSSVATVNPPLPPPPVSTSSAVVSSASAAAGAKAGEIAWKTPEWTKTATHAGESGEAVFGVFRPKPAIDSGESYSTDGLDSTVEVAQRFAAATAASSNASATTAAQAQPCGAGAPAAQAAPAAETAAAAAPFTFNFRTDQDDDEVPTLAMKFQRLRNPPEQWLRSPPTVVETPAHTGDAVFQCTGAAARRQQFYKLVSNTLQGDRARLLTVLVPPAAVSGSVALHIAQEFLPAFIEPAKGVSVPTIDCRPWALTEDTRCALMHDSVRVPPGQISLLQLTTGELWLRSITLEQATLTDLCSSVLPRLVWLRSLTLHNLHASTTIAQVVEAFSPHCPHLTSFASTGPMCADISAADAEAICGIPQLTALSLGIRAPLRCSLPLSQAPHLEDIALHVAFTCPSKMRKIAENLIPVAASLKRVCLENVLGNFPTFPRATTVEFRASTPTAFPHQSFPAARRITIQVNSHACLDDEAFVEKLRRIEELTVIAYPGGGKIAATVAAHAVTAAQITVNVMNDLVLTKADVEILEQLLKKNTALRRLKLAVLAHDTAPVVQRMLEARPALDLRYDQMLAEGAECNDVTAHWRVDRAPAHMTRRR